jgi:hypothetical protein
MTYRTLIRCLIIALSIAISNAPALADEPDETGSASADRAPGTRPPGDEDPGDSPGSADTDPSADTSAAAEEVAGSVLRSESESGLSIYGYLAVDLHYDTTAMDSPRMPAYVRNTQQDHETITINPGRTRLGIRAQASPLDDFGGLEVSGFLEIDLLGGGSGFRLRHAVATFQLGDFRLVGGKTDELIGPYYPSANDEMIMLFAGNVGDRRPQIRLEASPELGPVRVTPAVAAVLTGNFDRLASGVSGILAGEYSGVPGVQYRLGFQVDTGSDQPVELSFWGHYAVEAVAVPVNGRTRFPGRLFGASLSVPVGDMFYVRAEAWLGDNLDDVLAGIGQGVNSTTGRTISSNGLWVEAGVTPVDWLLVAAGWSVDDPRNTDLEAGGRTYNTVTWLAVHFSFGPAHIGIEWLNWRTGYLNAGDGRNDRFTIYFQYVF